MVTEIMKHPVLQNKDHIFVASKTFFRGYLSFDGSEILEATFEMVFKQPAVIQIIKRTIVTRGKW